MIFLWSLCIRFRRRGGERSSLRCEIQLAVSIVTGTNYSLEMTNWKDNQNYCQIFVPPSPLSHSSEDISVLVKQMKEKVLHLHPSTKKRFSFNKLNPLQTEIYTFHFTKLEGRIHKNFIEKVCLFHGKPNLSSFKRFIWITFEVQNKYCSTGIHMPQAKVLVFCIWTRLYGMNLNRSGMGLGQTWTRAWQLEFF